MRRTKTKRRENELTAEFTTKVEHNRKEDKTATATKTEHREVAQAKMPTKESSPFAPSDSNLESVLLTVSRLPQEHKRLLSSLLQSEPASILTVPSDGVMDWRNDLDIRGLSPDTVDLYSRTVNRVLKQYPNPSSQEIRSYLAEMTSPENLASCS